MHHLNGGDQSVGHDQSSGLFELESGNSIPYNRVVRQFQRSKAVEEFFVLRSQERQICFVFNNFNEGGDLLVDFGAFKSNLFRVGTQSAVTETGTCERT